MPRRQRITAEGALWHVYNRTGHGEPMFSEATLAQAFVSLMESFLSGDGHLVYAWAVLPNHYHVVLRSSAVPLARTFGRIQSGFGRYRNRVLGSKGPTWQSRYKAKLVGDESYLMQLVAYVHLNPVVAGLVDDLADYRHSGHLEVLGMEDLGLVARDLVLSMYGATEEEALRNYGAALAAAGEWQADWLRSGPGRLPWWGRDLDRPIAAPQLEQWIDEDGRPGREARPALDALGFLTAACTLLDMSLDELRERSANRKLTRLRYLVVGLGIERWQQKAGELARVLRRRPDYVSWWAKRARELRLTEPGFAERYRSLDEELRSRIWT